MPIQGVPDENRIGILAGLNERATLGWGIALAYRRRYPTKSRPGLQRPSNRMGNTVFGQLPKLGLLYVQVHSRTFFKLSKLAKPRERALCGWADDVTSWNSLLALPKVSKPVSGKTLERMVEFAHSSPTSIPRDPENEHDAHFWG